MADQPQQFFRGVGSAPGVRGRFVGLHQRRVDVDCPHDLLQPQPMGHGQHKLADQFPGVGADDANPDNAVRAGLDEHLYPAPGIAIRNRPVEITEVIADNFDFHATKRCVGFRQPHPGNFRVGERAPGNHRVIDFEFPETSEQRVDGSTMAISEIAETRLYCDGGLVASELGAGGTISGDLGLGSHDCYATHVDTFGQESDPSNTVTRIVLPARPGAPVLDQ